MRRELGFLLSSYQTRSTASLSQLENACELGRKLVLTSDNPTARARLAPTDQAREFMQIVRHSPFGGLTDVGRAIQAVFA